MREIKFRAWDAENKEWCGVDMAYSDDRHGPISTPVVFDGQDKCVIMQYTGLKDKNGNEIYEGDIVRIDGQVGAVEYARYAFAVTDFYEPSYDTPSDAFSEGLDECEVIGNIYENPDLLQS